MKDGHERGNLWSIVLAGGDGVRTKEFIRRRLGYEKPKQYCTFFGSHSMFQHTLDRATKLTLRERVVVVAARHHEAEVWSQFDGRPAGMVLLLPKNVDTAAGIFLPLTYILARDPQATCGDLSIGSFHLPGRFISVGRGSCGAGKQGAGRSAGLTRSETGRSGTGIRMDQTGTMSGLDRGGGRPSCGNIH